MIKGIRYFLLTVLSLSFLEMEVSAMMEENEDSNDNCRYIKATLSNKKPTSSTKKGKNKKHKDKKYKDWISYEGSWCPLPFNKFRGDKSLRTPDISSIEIPIDGIYTIIAAYHWRIKSGFFYNSNAVVRTDTYTEPATAISINTPENFSNCYLVHRIHEGGCVQGTLNYTDRFIKGDKIMLSIKGFKDAEYYRNNFFLQVKKIN
ncbi:MAG: hypothetical protein BGO67_10645 [Alphaproteobacteria bacterium 41-28]|nr:MAG: hypothetical protein BGO67_10645 [Alphaproteobacteria bacterium 41-28]